MIFGVVVDRLLLKSPLTDTPQVNCYTLLITKLGTEIIALTLHYCFNCATVVADSAIECYEICLPHTYILYSFALFFYPFLLFQLLIHISNIDLRIDKRNIKGLELASLLLDLEDSLGVSVDLIPTGSLNKKFLSAIKEDEVLLYE